MYHLVMYNISPIQQGIQAYHAGMEYARKWFNTDEFRQWVNEEKTVIILNGGTSNSNVNSKYYGTLQKYEAELVINEIRYAGFYEPDLNDGLSAIAFLVPEQVWDKEKYPDWNDYIDGKAWDEKIKCYGDWLDSIGGDKNEWLREFLSKFRLA